MYSLTIHFGPNAMVWSFLFKEQKNAGECLMKAAEKMTASEAFTVEDDFGQSGIFKSEAVHGLMLEDTEQVMEARIFRSLDNARGEIKAKQRAATDPVIRSAQQGPSVLQPRFNG